MLKHGKPIRRVINSSVGSFSAILRSDSLSRNAPLQQHRAKAASIFLISLIRWTNLDLFFNPTLVNIVAQSTGSLKCQVWLQLRVFAGAEEKKKKKDGTLRPGEGKVFASRGGGVTAFSQGRPTSRRPHLKHTERAVQSLGPPPFTKGLRSHDDTSATRGDRHGAGGRWQLCADTSRAGTGEGGGVSPGPTLYRSPMSLDTTKVNSWRNRSGRLVTWGMCVNPALVSGATLFNRRDQTWCTRSSRRLSSACASLDPTAHAEPPRSTQAPTGWRPLFVTDHGVQVLREQRRMWTLGGPEKYVFSLSLAFAK